MEHLIPKIKLSKKNNNEKMQPLKVDYENNPSLQKIIEAFESSDKVTLGFSTLEKDGQVTKPTLKKKILYMTGASLRDHLNGKTFYKYNLTTNATPEETRLILKFFKFSEFQPLNQDFSAKYLKLNKITNNPYKFCANKWDSYGNEMGFEINVKGQILEIETLNENSKTNFEKPSLRKFTNSLYEDAITRDFTVNAVYLKLKNFEGENTELFDPIHGVHDIVHNEIHFATQADKKIQENPTLMFKLVELSTRFCDGGKVSSSNIDVIKSNLDNTKNYPKKFKNSFVSAINNDDVPTFNYLKNLYISGLMFKLFPNLKIHSPHISLFNDYLFVVAYLLQNNSDQEIFENLIKLDYHKFEIKEILFIKAIIDWTKTNNEEKLKSILLHVTNVPIHKTILFVKIFNKEKEFKKILEKYSNEVI